MEEILYKIGVHKKKSLETSRNIQAISMYILPRQAPRIAIPPVSLWRGGSRTTHWGLLGPSTIELFPPVKRKGETAGHSPAAWLRSSGRWFDPPRMDISGQSTCLMCLYMDIMRQFYMGLPSKMIRVIYIIPAPQFLIHTIALWNRLNWICVTDPRSVS